MLEYNCDANIQGPNGWTALHFLAHTGDLDLLKIISRHGSKKDSRLTRNDSGATPFYTACQQGQVECLDLLFAGRQSLVLCTLDGLAPIHIATMNNYLDVIRYMITGKDLDVDFRTTDGKTSLHFAAEQNRMEILDFLIR